MFQLSALTSQSMVKKSLHQLNVPCCQEYLIFDQTLVNRSWVVTGLCSLRVQSMKMGKWRRGEYPQCTSTWKCNVLWNDLHVLVKYSCNNCLSHHYMVMIFLVVQFTWEHYWRSFFSPYLDTYLLRAFSWISLLYLWGEIVEVLGCVQSIHV